MEASVGLLAQVQQPRDLDHLSETELEQLVAEIRAHLVENVSARGGHLGPNLGVVELTVALHRVFDSPRDAIVWDTGHQAYVHKLLTGRAADFSTLRETGGLSGYPSRTESVHDIVENSHASTSLSWADGIAKAWGLSGELADGPSAGRHVVAVIGDGALTGGMAWEAINNIAGSDRQVIIIVNDNERSYAPTIGGLASHLMTLRTTGGYERFLEWGKRLLGRTPLVGEPAYHALHGVKKGMKDIIAPQGMFEDLGLKYLGPVDGHNLVDLEHIFRRARNYPGPVIVHAITQKGRGYAPAENDDADRFHGVGVINPATGQPVTLGGRTWTHVFGDEIVRLAEKNPRVVAITAAMLRPTGLGEFSRMFPERCFDVGIAEQHAVASAAGMAFAGLHPVVAIYSTFVNRAFDQVLLDCGLHEAPVTLVLDRAGVTGPDGASHHGVWDLSILGIVPDLQVAAPRDGQRLRELLADVIAYDDGPSAIRFPSGTVPADIPSVESHGSFDVLARPLAVGECDVVLVAAGATAAAAMDAAERVVAHGLTCAVIDPRWLNPIRADLVNFLEPAAHVITVEDNIRAGGFGTRLATALSDAGVAGRVDVVGTPVEYLPHGTRSDVHTLVGLTGQDLARTVVELAAKRQLTPRRGPRTVSR